MSMAGRHTNAKKRRCDDWCMREPASPGRSESSTRLSSRASRKDPNCETFTLGVLRKQTVSSHGRDGLSGDAVFRGSLFGTRLALLSPDCPARRHRPAIDDSGAVWHKEVYSAYQNSSRTRRCRCDGGRTCSAGIGADSVSSASDAGPAAGSAAGRARPRLHSRCVHRLKATSFRLMPPPRKSRSSR